MSGESASRFERFREQVWDDPRLARELDVSMSHDDYPSFVARLAAARGFDITADEVRDAMREGQLAFLTHWNPEE